MALCDQLKSCIPEAKRFLFGVLVMANMRWLAHDFRLTQSKLAMRNWKAGCCVPLHRRYIFRFFSVVIDGLPVVVLKVERAFRQLGGGCIDDETYRGLRRARFRGSEVDKIVFQTELYQLPAPIFGVSGDNTLTILFAHKPLIKMDLVDRARACYLHACLKYVNGEYLTNASLRERFGVDEQNKAAVSRYIREAVEAGMIKPYDEDAARIMMKYVPFWA